MMSGTPRRRPRKNVLSILAALLIVSALTRLGEHAGQAWAENSFEEPMQTVDEQVTPESLQIILDALADREAKIEDRERKFEERLAELDAAEQTVREQIKLLQDVEDELAATLTIADQAAENDVAKLTAVYENMKAKEAAELFETMDPAFAAGFLGRMKPDAAAGILAGLQPDTAYAISVVLAGRNANAPTE